jgi:hypothetical protein
MITSRLDWRVTFLPEFAIAKRCRYPQLSAPELESEER